MLSKYINIPWSRGAASFEVCDCVGLVYLFYKHEFDIDVGFMVNRASSGKREALKEAYDYINGYKAFERTEKPSFGDIVLINNYGDIPSHVGIFVGRNKILHSAIKSRSCIERIDTSFKNKVEGFYVHKERK